MKTKIVHIILLFALGSLSYSAQNFNALFDEIKELTFLGEFDFAKDKIYTLTQKTIDNTDKAELFYQLGYISKLEGDIDQAFLHWENSNQYRSNAFPNGDYHLAWNYALLSNYHYEKINKKLAIEYADSCLNLINGLTDNQMLEIEAFKIWNILGQSYKESNMDLAQSLYLKSLNFIKLNIYESHYLAETYRLLGNSYLDRTITSTFENKLPMALQCYELSNKFYDQALPIWKQLYGEEHYELARTYFVKGLLNFYVKNDFGPRQQELSIEFFELAFSAYGVDISDSQKVNLDKIPNKEDFLMTCRYLTLSYFREFNSDSSFLWIEKSTKVNEIAIRTWETIHQEFDGTNTNQNLAIYNLVPFSETITIEMFKKMLGHEYSLNSIFSANQKLKYYDLLKYNGEVNDNPAGINIAELQKRLKNEEVFLDFYISRSTKSIIVLSITSQSSELIELPFLESGLIEKFLLAIESFDFDSYTNVAYEIYQAIIKPCKVGNRNLILCLDGRLNSIPFEALLTTKSNWEKEDYRKLSFLLLKNRIQYVLNPQMFRCESISVFDFSIEAFIPDNPGFTSLPFSEQLGKNLQSKFDANVHLSKSSTKRNFLKLNSSIVHLSGHGVVSGDDIMNSYLVLSDSSLHLSDIENMQHAPNLMVLNTCNSANGKMYIGEGLNGFVKALNVIGTKAVISNLWNVDDHASNNHLEYFYGLLSDGKLTTNALHMTQINAVQQAQISNMAAPYYWAGHRLTGEETVFEKVAKKKGERSVFWLLLLPIVIVGIIFLRRKVTML